MTTGRFGSAMLRAAVESTLASRARYAEAMGMAFGGKRDYSKALGYADTLTPEMYRKRFERGGIAARLVKEFPKATWGAGADIYDDENADTETPFETAIQESFKRLKMWQVLMRLDILAGLGRYGVLLIGRGQEDLSQPAGEKGGPIQWLQPLGEEQAKIKSLVTNIRDPRFGLPTGYVVRIIDGETNVASMDVDHTHCIHFVENPLLTEVFGEPRLRAPWNDLDDLDKLKGGGAEAAWRRAHMGMNARIDPEVAKGMSDTELTEQMSKVAEQLDEYDHNMRRFLQTVGIEIDTLDGTPFNFDSNVKATISIIAATQDIPQRKLMGSGIGEMTGKMEDDTFNDVVAYRRTVLAEPTLRELIDTMIKSGEVPEPKGGKYEIAWPEEQELDENDKASLAGTIATANKAQKDAGGEPIMLGSEIRDRVWGLKPIPQPDLDALEPEIPPQLDPNSPDYVPPSTGQATDGAPPAAGDPSSAAPPPPPGAGSRAPRAAARGGGAAVQKAVHKVADARAEAMERAFRNAFHATQQKVDLAALEQALANGDADQATALLAKAVEEFGALLDEQLPTAIAGKVG